MIPQFKSLFILIENICELYEVKGPSGVGSQTIQNLKELGWIFTLPYERDSIVTKLCKFLNTAPGVGTMFVYRTNSFVFIEKFVLKTNHAPTPSPDGPFSK